MDGRLVALEIGPAGESLYRHILRTPGQPLLSYATELALTDEDAADAVRQLREHRLVRIGTDGAITADHPRAALERVVSIEEARLATKRQDLARLRDAIDQFATDYRVGQELSSAAPPARERVDSTVLVSVHEQLAASSVGPIRRTGTSADDVSPAEYPTTAAQLEAGREVRALYVADALETNLDAARWRDLGESQRVVPSVPSQFVCFGTDAALATTQWGKADGNWVVLRDPMVVAAFVELFDRLWLNAAPAPESGDTDDLIELMRQGLKDEAIARVLGMSLRTVRRRIAALMDAYGVETRFQLALELAARGQAEVSD